MRLWTRLGLAILAAALLPLLLLGVAATKTATTAITRTVVDLHVQRSNNLATYVDTYMSAQLRGLGLMLRAFRVGELSDEGKRNFQRLIYRQFDDMNVVSLVGSGGADLSPSQYYGPEAADSLPPAHQIISQARFRAFRSSLPWERALAEGYTVADPYVPPDADHPVVPIAVARQDGNGPVVLGVELSLELPALRFQSQASESQQVAMLDASGSIILAAGPDLIAPRHFLPFLGGNSRADISYDLDDGRRVLAALSPIPTTGWLAVVAEPYAHAARPGREIIWRSAYFGGVAAVMALILGLLFSRQLTRPVVQLRNAAVALGEGKLGRVVEPDRIRELGDLGRAFNEMSQRLKDHRDQIDAQQREIQAFNEELQQRVEERTRELREAQARLVESGKLAAVAELGAGLAHELNNPLASVLGLAQILQTRMGEAGEGAPLVRSLEEQARRCSDILKNLQTITREEKPDQDLSEVDLNRTLQEVLSLVQGSFQQRSIQIRYTPAPEPLPIQADHSKLSRALVQLLTSLRAVAAEGATVDIVGGERTRATGKGAPEVQVEFLLSHLRDDLSHAERDDWYASGMSLWVARRILSEHGGRLVEPDPGSEGRYVLILPKAGDRA